MEAIIAAPAKSRKQPNGSFQLQTWSNPFPQTSTRSNLLNI
jgi:hypothetical protein